jgi:hypothetical protein
MTQQSIGFADIPVRRDKYQIPPGARVLVTEATGFAGSVLVRKLANVADTRRHLSSHPETIVIARRGKWGQCLGADVERDLSCKAALMKRDLDCIKKSYDLACKQR